MYEEAADERTYVVVVNDEEQHSVWLAGRPLPAGWSPTEFTGSRPECLAHIDEVWTDIRPLSLRRWLADQSGGTR
ncbi:MbtH family protein [Actinoplanes derwentensis]|uniref:MbtH protein n=1 Tax=Actinoplanes derwentensis TaxID=113562 RepID=A0A1H2DCM8_9ACTN|nr:MbtH family protein [Actinoplanes derwentensis]GID89555.1 MbtH protein [Actinoplanes derwentensis]SDT80508.1 MbtH protein [Actinoplanes derwentensis]